MNPLTKIARRLGWVLPDPTSQFPPLSPALTTSYAFATRTLNGIPYSAPAASLEPLGPASRMDRSGGPDDIELFYLSLGLSVALDREGVVSFELHFTGDGLTNGPLATRRTTLDLSLGDQPPIRVDRDTGAAQLDAILGPPHDRFAGDTSGELGTIYLVAGTHVATFHSADGAELRMLMLSESEG